MKPKGLLIKPRLSLEAKRKLIIRNKVGWHKGHKHSEGTKKNWSLKRKGKPSRPPGWHHTEDALKKMRGRKLTEEQREHLSRVFRKPSNLIWKDGASIPEGGYYGRTLVQKEKLAGRPQPNACEICGATANGFKRFMQFDHDHQTGKFRGWICYRCNTALGMVHDNINTLQSLINYLLKNQNA